LLLGPAAEDWGNSWLDAAASAGEQVSIVRTTDLCRECRHRRRNVTSVSNTGSSISSSSSSDAGVATLDVEDCDLSDVQTESMLFGGAVTVPAL